MGYKVSIINIHKYIGEEDIRTMNEKLADAEIILPFDYGTEWKIVVFSRSLPRLRHPYKE